MNINRWVYALLESFCTTKEPSNKINSQHTKLEKIFASHVSNKGVIKIYEKFIELNIKQKQSFLKKKNGQNI